MNIDLEEKEKLWKQFKEEKGHLNIGTKKDVIFWTYDKLLLNQITARKEIAELKKNSILLVHHSKYNLKSKR